jgi:hypothetical protein
MNSSNMPDQLENREALCTRIQNLERMVSASADRYRRRSKISLFVGISLILICTFSLLSVTNMIRQLDAQAVTQIGRAHVEKQLPGEMENIKAYLKAQAPQFVSDLLRASLGMFPKLRAEVVQTMDERTRVVTEHYEREFVEKMQEVIQSTKKNIDQLDSGQSALQRFELLLTFIIEKFRIISMSYVQSLYPHYSMEMDRIKSFLVDLHHKDEGQLTERQKIQKELIQTLLRLMSYEELKTH